MGTEEREQDFLTERLLKLDLYSLCKDIIINFWVIILCSAIVAMGANMYANYLGNSGSSYTAETLLVVSAKGTESNVYSNLSSAQTMASSLSNIMKSNLMSKRVVQELELDSFTATVNPQVVDETNLLRLQVTDSSPERAYRVLKSILNNYDDIASSVMGSIMVETLVEPTVPSSSNYSGVGVVPYTKRGAMIGLLIGLFLVMMCSVLNDTVKSSQDMSDKIDAKNLGTIYFEHKYKTLKSKIKHKKSSILVTNSTTSFAFVESYKKIAAKVSYLKPHHSGLSVVITSILENEGKSTVATNIALTLAGNGSRVIVIDCDLRKPAQDRVLYSRRTTGYSLPDYLMGSCQLEDIITYDKARNLYAILTKKELDKASELLSGEKMAELLAILKKEYDYVILDTPPLSGAADAESLADRCDASLLVIRYDQAQAADINDCIDLLDGCRAEVVGCVLNQVHVLGSGNSSNGYGYGYNKYYSGSYYSRNTEERKA